MVTSAPLMMDTLGVCSGPATALPYTVLNGQENKQPVEIQPTSLGRLGVLVSPLLTENSLVTQSPHVMSQPVNIPYKEVDSLSGMCVFQYTNSDVTVNAM